MMFPFEVFTSPVLDIHPKVSVFLSWASASRLAPTRGWLPDATPALQSFKEPESRPASLENRPPSVGF